MRVSHHVEWVHHRTSGKRLIRVSQGEQRIGSSAHARGTLGEAYQGFDAAHSGLHRHVRRDIAPLSNVTRLESESDRSRAC